MLIPFSELKFKKNVHGIIHIGAHDCEERILYLMNFHNITDNEIVWIDALKNKVESIKENYPSIIIFNECISDKDNEIVIFNVTNNYQSSSFLNLKEHRNEHPDIYEIEKIEMKTKTLKTLYNENNFKHDQFNFMALDIQGAELLALKGAENILNFIDYIYLEVNTKELYENCALLNDIDSYLKTFGFNRETILMTTHGWGDAFYVKNTFDIHSNIKIEYGTEIVKIDITDKVLNNYNENGIIYIPENDYVRSSQFTDPIYGFLKKIFIETGNDKYIIDASDYVYIDINQKKLYINFNPNKL